MHRPNGDVIAASVDQMKIGLIKLTILAERQVNFFLNRNVNQTFPPFLNLNRPGLTLALQGVHFVATSTTASNSIGNTWRTRSSTAVSCCSSRPSRPAWRRCPPPRGLAGRGSSRCRGRRRSRHATE
jgi:hypothetical protein